MVRVSYTRGNHLDLRLDRLPSSLPCCLHSCSAARRRFTTYLLEEKTNGRPISRALHAMAIAGGRAGGILDIRIMRPRDSAHQGETEMKDSSSAVLTDSEALLAIQELLSGKDWDIDTLVTVSEIVANAGYEIAPLAWEDGQ